MKSLVKNYGVVLAFVLLVIVLAVLSPKNDSGQRIFLTADNLINVARQIAVNGIIATGMTMVIITGGIDLSVGSVLALSGCVMAKVMVAGAEGSAFPSILRSGVFEGIFAGLLVAALCGFVNGFIITKADIPPFIVTLGTMIAARGLVRVYTKGYAVVGFPDSFKVIGQGEVFHIPYPVLLMAVVMASGAFILKHTTPGRYAYAIGGNEDAARLSGISVHKIKIFFYTLCSFFAGVGGIITASRLSSAQPEAGTMYELDAIAAAVIGGTSLMGGQGHMTGTFIGAAIMGVLRNGLVLLDVPANWQYVATGTIIVLAVYIDKLRQRIK